MAALVASRERGMISVKQFLEERRVKLGTPEYIKASDLGMDAQAFDVLCRQAWEHRGGDGFLVDRPPHADGSGRYDILVCSRSTD